MKSCFEELWIRESRNTYSRSNFITVSAQDKTVEAETLLQEAILFNHSKPESFGAGAAYVNFSKYFLILSTVKLYK